MKSKFKIIGLDCANCVAELDRKVQKIKGIESVSVNFITQKMEFEYDESIKDEILQKVKEVVKKEEPDVNLEEL